MISIGKHRAVCRSTALGYSSKGTEQVALDFIVTDKEDSDCGQTITVYRFFSPNALKYTVADLRTLGWSGSDPSTLPESGFPAEVQIVVEHEEYDGKTRPKIKFINALGGGMKNRMDETQRRSFGASMRGQIAALGGDAAAVDNQPLPANPDDDLPF